MGKGECRECGIVEVLREVNGDVVCRKCGMLIEDDFFEFSTYREKSQIRVSDTIDPIRTKEARYQSKQDKRDISLKELKNKIKYFSSEFNLSKIIERNAKIILIKMHKDNNLAGSGIEVSILAVIKHLLLEESSKFGETQKGMVNTISNKINLLSDISVSSIKNMEDIEGLRLEIKKNIKYYLLDLEISLLLVEKIQKFFDFPEKNNIRVNNRLKNYFYPKNILEVPALSLGNVMSLDPAFANSFEMEDDFLSLISRDSSNEEKILELRKDSINYALIFIVVINPFNGGKIPRGLFRSCFYYLIKHYFSEEFQDVEFTEKDYSKFFHLKRENLQRYVRIFKEKPLDKKILTELNLLD